ncbi:nascent polypeptide-associated complex protein [Candidatus Woesearchaeota archaeon]|jgi:nascent polypeptide-associated complex subunit alpha|nr:nascent polypeptide-associated complex protein [Candidatus Woesearchaeota archaeon]
MMPNIDSRMIKKAMKKMGMAQQEIEDVNEVIIICSDKKIVINNPSVTKITMGGQETFQVIGDAEEKPVEEKEAEITEEDIKTVMEQTGCNKKEAAEAIKRNNNDLAEAIIELKK